MRGSAHTVGKAESEPSAETGLLTEGSCRESGGVAELPKGTGGVGGQCEKNF